MHHCVHPCQSQPSHDGGGPSDDVHAPRSSHDGHGAPKPETEELARGAAARKQAERFGRLGCSVLGVRNAKEMQRNGNEIGELMVSILHLRERER